MSKNREKFLVTTALESTWAEGHVVFAGEWCRRYERKKVWAGRTHELLSYHWDDRDKLEQDRVYLKGLHDDLIGRLSVWLNGVHQVDRGERYWQMILDPWLQSYVGVLFDRWEIIRTAFELHHQYACVALDCAEKYVSYDYNDYISAVISDEWNYAVFDHILRYRYAPYCHFIPTAESSQGNFDRSGRPSHSNGVKSIVKSVLGALCAIGNHTVFYHSYLERFNAVLLAVRLGQLPCYSDGAFGYDDLVRGDYQKNAAVRGTLTSCFAEGRSDFEQYLFSCLADDMPLGYVEGYRDLLIRAQSVRYDPKVIVTGVGHWTNTLFKVWAAEKAAEGRKLVIVQHGGSINVGPKLSMDFEHEIGDFYATPSAYSASKCVRLPFALKTAKAQDDSRWCSFIGFDSSRYVYRIEPVPLAGQVLECYSQSVAFFSFLSDSVKSDFRVRPYPHNYWDTRQRYSEDLGPEYISGPDDFIRFLSTSRLVICSYPNTTFAQVLASGIPTILLYHKDLWGFDDWALPLVEQMTEAKLIFSDAWEAALHVSGIWGRIEPWWNEPSVLSARNAFKQKAVYTASRRTWVLQWAQFLRSI